MTRKNRKVTCPRCHRSVSSSEYAEHVQTHKGKHRIGKQQTRSIMSQSEYKEKPKYEVKSVGIYRCDCGLEFENRNDLWNHVKICKDITDARQTCSICSEPEEVFLSTEDIERICPTCALGYFESKKTLGVPLINHMGIEYEKAFRDKAGSLLKHLRIGALTELGITIVLITFSADGSTAYCISSRGEVVFVLNDTKELRKMNYESFESVVSHEIFHAYITNKLKLGISSKLHHALTAVGRSAVQLAEDIELIKIASRKNIEPLLWDEVNRTRAYYKNLPKPVPMKYWASVPDHDKFLSMMSVTWSYASTQWLMQNTREPKLKEQFSQNLELVRPHYAANGFSKLKDLITDLLNTRVVATEKGAENVFERILHLYCEFLDDSNLDLR
jgi:hypothetical protein